MAWKRLISISISIPRPHLSPAASSACAIRMPTPARWCCLARRWSWCPSPSTAPRRPRARCGETESGLAVDVSADEVVLTIVTPHQSVGQPHAVRAVSVSRRFLHPVRGRGLPSHHLFPRSAGHHGPLHRAPGGRRRHLPGAALQRQPARNRPLAQRPALCPLGRPLPQAVLPVCAGGRRAVGAGAHRHHHERPRRAAAGVGRGAGSRPRRARDGFAGAFAALGRGGVWPRARPRPLHDRRRVGFQHGRNGEQGPQHLQHQVRAGQPGNRHRSGL